MARGWKAFLRERSRHHIYSRTTATAHSPTLPQKQDSFITDGGRAFASATTITTAGTISSSATSVRMFFTTTTATAHLRTSRTKPESAAMASAGTLAAPSWTTIETASLIFSSPTTLIW